MVIGTVGDEDERSCQLDHRLWLFPLQYSDIQGIFRPQSCWILSLHTRPEFGIPLNIYCQFTLITMISLILVV